MTSSLFDYQPPPHLLAGRVILVTGAGRGIGRAAAVACARHGASVILLGKTIKALEAVYDAIEACGGPQPAIYPLDLTCATETDYEKLTRIVGAEFGRLDGLINNAAMLDHLGPLRHYPAQTWAKVLQVNLNAPFLLTRCCLDLLQSADRASVVFTTDFTGRAVPAYWGAYGVSKPALVALMQIYADELESNTRIRVNCIDPGPCRTHLRTGAYPAKAPELWPLPEQLTSAYLYLMGDDSTQIHRQILRAQKPAADASKT